MNSLPFYPLVWKTASGTFRGSLTWDMTLSVTLTLMVAIGFVLLLGMLVNPSLLIQKVLQILPPLIVMMDTSGSMALSEPGKPTRLQQVKNYLHSGEHAALAALAQHYQLKLYQFDE